MSGRRNKSSAMIQSFKKINSIKGTLTFKGDKSISHRALLISSLAKGKSIIKNLSESDDVKSTIKCLIDLGIQVEYKNGIHSITGKGYKGFHASQKSLDAGNSGTTARLLTGILSAQNFESEIIGDKSLSTRPMNRIIEPLTQMGTNLNSNNGKLPIKISSSNNFRAINYFLPVPSAQVKSSILLAGLHLEEQSSVVETTATRNHTENLLGLSVERDGTKIKSFVSRKNYPDAKEYFIPGDVSSAMFFIVLALIVRDSELIIKDISLNPTRTECLNILKQMGGRIQIDLKGVSNNEVFGDVIVKSSRLSNIIIRKEIIPLIIDEIPILAIAGIFAEGNYELRGASELRVKESDRIKAICKNLLKIGLTIDEHEDGFSVIGLPKNIAQTFESFYDHRIAMAFAILSSLLDSGGNVDKFECVSVSNPEFLNQLRTVSS